MTEEFVRTEMRGACLEIILNRPERLNALNPEMVEALAEAIESAKEDEVRVAILRAEGKGFCAGGDVKMFREAVTGERQPSALTPDGLHVCIQALADSPRIFVAAVHGACAGAGLGLSMACDLVVAANTAKFCTAYLGIGASPDAGSTHFLPRLVGRRKAMELFLAPLVFGADEAARMGLINRVCEADALLDDARSFADQLAQGPTSAYRHLKALMRSTYDTSLPDQLALESQAIQHAFKTDDFREGVTAFTEKRMPTFTGS